jgi:ankyrin repeat protein
MASKRARALSPGLPFPDSSLKRFKTDEVSEEMAAAREDCFRRALVCVAKQGWGKEVFEAAKTCKLVYTDADLWSHLVRLTFVHRGKAVSSLVPSLRTCDVTYTPLLSVTLAGSFDRARWLVTAAAAKPCECSLYNVCDASYKEVAEETAALFIEKGARLEDLSRSSWGQPIAAACRAGRPRLVALLVRAGANLDLNWGQSPLSWALQHGHMDVLDAIFARPKEDSIGINQAGENGYTPLMLAIEKGLTTAALQMINNRGADLNAVLGSRDGETRRWRPIHFAARTGQLAILDALLAKKAAADFDDRYPQTPSPLSVAAQEGRLDACKVLVAAGASLKDGEGMHPLDYASRAGHEEVFEFLLSAGAEITAGCDTNRRYCIHWACRAGNVKIATRILELMPGHASLPGSAGTPIFEASRVGNKELFFILLHKAPTSIFYESGSLTPIMLLACGCRDDGQEELKWREAVKRTEGDRVAIVQELIKRGAGVNAVHRYVSPLMVAAQNGCLDLCRLLVANGASPSNVEKALELAVLAGQQEVSLFLLEHTALTVQILGAAIGSPGRRSQEDLALELIAKAKLRGQKVNWGASLQQACSQGLIDVAFALIEEGADVASSWGGARSTSLHELASGSLQLESGWTPNKSGRTIIDLARELVAKGANVNAETERMFVSDADTPLLRAMGARDEDLCLELLRLGASPFRLTGRTPLAVACRYGLKRVATTLIDSYGCKADDFVAEMDWCPPLVYALRRDDHELALALLARKADPNLFGKSVNDKPLLVALRRKSAPMVEALLAHGARTEITCDKGKSMLYKACEKGLEVIARSLIRAGADVNFVYREKVDKWARGKKRKSTVRRNCIEVIVHSFHGSFEMQARMKAFVEARRKGLPEPELPESVLQGNSAENEDTGPDDLDEMANFSVATSEPRPLDEEGNWDDHNDYYYDDPYDFGGYA